MDREVFSTSQMHPACKAIIIVFCNVLRSSRSVCVCACKCIHKALFVSVERSEILMKSRSDHIWEAVDDVVMCDLSLPRHTRMSLMAVLSVSKLGSWPLCLDIAVEVVMTVCAQRGQRLGWGVVTQREGCW